MAAHPVVIVDDALLQQLSEPYRSDPRYQRGARLELVPVMDKGRSPEEIARAWDEFRTLEGLLAGSDFDPNAELEKEKKRELEAEARWARS